MGKTKMWRFTTSGIHPIPCRALIVDHERYGRILLFKGFKQDKAGSCCGSFRWRSGFAFRLTNYTDGVEFRHVCESHGVSYDGALGNWALFLLSKMLSNKTDARLEISGREIERIANGLGF